MKALLQEIRRLEAQNDALTERLKNIRDLSIFNMVLFCAVSFFMGMIFMGFLTKLIGG
ncbi:MAG: hypothetical protein ABIA77_02010 [Candidatus Omnitrophota bacterium]